MANAMFRQTTVGEGPLFLSTAATTRKDRRLPVAVIAISLLLFIAAVPFASVPLTPLRAFIPVYESALIISDLITAVLLYAQFSMLRLRALLVLACGYLFTALIAVAHLLTFPGAFSPTGLLGAGPQTTAWLYMFWHGGFPLAVIAYALTKTKASAIPPPPGSARGQLAFAIGEVAVAVVLLTILATSGQTMLPAIMRDDHYSQAMIFVVSSIWLLSALAALAAARDNPAPRARPATSSVAALRRIIAVTSARCAPSAMRMPISLVRTATVYDITPYSPIIASTTASAPKNPESVASSRSASSDCRI